MRMAAFLRHAPPVLAVLVSSVHANADESLRQAAAAMGITPTALIACGASTIQTQTLFNNIRGGPQVQLVIAARVTLATAETGLSNALKTLDPLDEAGSQVVDEATAAVAAARTQIAAAIAALIQTAEHDLPEPVRQRLALWRGNAGTLPAEFRIVQWVATDLVAVQSALLEEKLATTGQSTISAEAASLLAQTRARPEIAAAAQRLQVDLASMDVAFQQAIQ